MYEVVLQDIDLGMIMDSGQVFRIREIGENLFFVAAGKNGVVIRQSVMPDSDNTVRLRFSCTEEEFREFWYSYFDLGTDYGKIKLCVDPEDDFLGASLRYGGGIRVLRQDLWEMIISFLISQNNNISRIRKSIEALCERFGEECMLPDSMMESFEAFSDDFPADHFPKTFYGFPTPEDIFSRGLDGLKELGLGYRDKYLFRMAERCCGDSGKEWLDTLAKSSYDDAVVLLMQEFGIGRKVADCICLFALHHVDAFPIDTHIRQILTQFYPQGFPFERYQGFAGILQQYMFAYKLTLPKGSK